MVASKSVWQNVMLAGHLKQNIFQGSLLNVNNQTLFLYSGFVFLLNQITLLLEFTYKQTFLNISKTLSFTQVNYF